ncbi:MAG: biopolymer transporter ExbD [Akkermansia sp.]|nr:biopolymer transporter ExbD [Akkermansia sp.]MBR6576684.1 biopolymer transporter ExbD [Akkermansia sp.]
MAKKNARAQDETKAELNMSSMMDACFLLIIFFVVNASQITVAKDPCVKMPNAITCSDMKDANGCVVVNVFPDIEKMDDRTAKKFGESYAPGTAWSVSDGAKTIGFAPEQTQDLTDFITKQVEMWKAKNIDPSMIRLYLRGDKDAAWDRSATVIRCAAVAGLSNVVFGTLPAK